MKKDTGKKNRRVLIIDDNESIHKDFKAILASNNNQTKAMDAAKTAIFGDQETSSEVDGFEVDSAFQGQEGLEKVLRAVKENRPYAMAFVDIRMPPGWDGVETIQRIWKQYPELQVVICTAYSDYQWEDIIKKLGQSDQLLILKKPFDNVEVNQLASSLTEKWHLVQINRMKQQELEHLVEFRTQELETSNKELIVALKEAERAVRTKGEFLANMSHEIRTPMNSVIGFSELLAEENLNQEQKKYVDMIYSAGHNLLEIINDILDYSKIEAGKLSTETIDCALNELLSDAESLLRPMASKKDLEFKVNKYDGLPDKIYTDPLRVRQCLINLVSNAIKFTDEGHVYINASLEECRETSFVRFDIEDTGIGIASDRQPEIFDSFSQADNSTTRKFGGTGLGLAITKKLAYLLGGDLTLTSQEGKGSVFTLRIPTGDNVDRSNSQTSTEKPHADSESTRTQEDSIAPELAKFSGNVLVVEDTQANQKLIKTLLERMGLTVAIVADGQQVLTKVQKESFDLILMDIQMPNVNGYEATQQLRQNGITTPVIALTANAMMGDDKKCMDAGCDGYLAKPIDRKKFVKVISKYLTPADKHQTPKTQT